MAEQLIVLGNGFDLSTQADPNDANSNLKTSYTAFINRKFPTNTDTWTLIELARKHYAEHLTSDFPPEKEDKIILDRINAWYWIMFIGRDSRELNWSDVEKQMYDHLTNGLIEQIASDSLGEMITKKSFQESPNDHKKVARLLFDKFRNEWFSKRKNPPSTVTAEVVRDWLYASLNELERDFEDYLNGIIQPNTGGGPSARFFEPTYKDKLTSRFVKPSYELLTKIVNEDLTDPNRIGDPGYNILNFNYTNLYDNRYWALPMCEKYDSPVRSPENALNVHGLMYVREKGVEARNTSHIIFGIDRENINPTDNNFVFTKTYRTLYGNADEHQIFQQNHSNVFDKENIKVIKFFGHSLGNADYSYFQQMFDYFDLYNNDDLKLIFYFRKYDGRPVNDFVKIQTNQVINLIDTYGKTLSNEAHGKNLLTRLQMLKRISIKQLHWNDVN
ncbi:AbiH family protein [Lactobacillaceae bacterium L1_55_11]|nr:AbiH family protein [Lactobacillaceae bacterium L1_55_11]